MHGKRTYDRENMHASTLSSRPGYEHVKQRHKAIECRIKTEYEDTIHKHGREKTRRAYLVLVIHPRHVNERKFRHALDFTGFEAFLLGEVSATKNEQMWGTRLGGYAECESAMHRNSMTIMESRSHRKNTQIRKKSSNNSTQTAPRIPTRNSHTKKRH